MANALNTELTGKAVIIKQEALASGLINTEQPFRVDGGFGAHAFTSGTNCAGEWLSDGERAAVHGYVVERLATEDEISAAMAKRAGAE
jgi:hypothetical protein